MFWMECFGCQTSTPPSLDEAIVEGWVGVVRAVDDPVATHMGYCPDCQVDHADDCAGLPVLGPGALL